MKNGDRVLGKILKIQRGDLYFDGDMTGDVKIDLKDIEYIKGVKRLYRVDVFGAGEFVGNIEIAGPPGSFHISGQPEGTIYKITDIISVMGFEKGFWQKLDGNLNLGYSFTKSSDITRFNLSNEVIFTSQKWRVGEYFSSIYTVGDGNGFERIDLSLRSLWQIKPRWGILGITQFQRILELGVDQRWLGLLGVGRRLIKSRHVELDLGTGIAGQQEKSTDGTLSALQMEIPILLNFSLFQLKKPDIEISNTSIFYYSLSVSGRYRLDYSININYEVIKDFLIGFEFFFNYDSKPLGENTSNSDMGTVFTLGYKF